MLIIQITTSPSFIFVCLCILGFFWRQSLQECLASLAKKFGAAGESVSAIRDRVAAKREEMQKRKGKVYQAGSDEEVRYLHMYSTFYSVV